MNFYLLPLNASPVNYQFPKMSKATKREGRKSVSVSKGEFISFGDVVSDDISSGPEKWGCSAVYNGNEDNFAVVLKKMLKKSTLSKTKAIQEFMELVEKNPSVNMSEILPNFSYLYLRLFLDNSPEVRQLLHLSLEKIIRFHYECVLAFTDIFVGPIWLSLSDPVSKVSIAAQNTLKLLFPSITTSQIIVKYSFQIFLWVDRNFKTKIDEIRQSQLCCDENEVDERFQRVISMAIASISRLMSNCNIENLKLYYLGIHGPDDSEHSRTAFSLRNVVNESLLKRLNSRFPLIRKSIYDLFITIFDHCSEYWLVDNELFQRANAIAVDVLSEKVYFSESLSYLYRFISSKDILWNSEIIISKILDGFMENLSKFPDAVLDFSLPFVACICDMAIENCGISPKFFINKLLEYVCMLSFTTQSEQESSFNEVCLRTHVTVFEIGVYALVKLYDVMNNADKDNIVHILDCIQAIVVYLSSIIKKCWIGEVRSSKLEDWLSFGISYPLNNVYPTELEPLISRLYKAVLQIYRKSEMRCLSNFWKTLLLGIVSAVNSGNSDNLIRGGCMVFVVGHMMSYLKRNVPIHSISTVPDIYHVVYFISEEILKNEVSLDLLSAQKKLTIALLQKYILINVLPGDLLQIENQIIAYIVSVFITFISNLSLRRLCAKILFLNIVWGEHYAFAFDKCIIILLHVVNRDQFVLLWTELIHVLQSSGFLNDFLSHCRHSLHSKKSQLLGTLKSCVCASLLDCYDIRMSEDTTNEFDFTGLTDENVLCFISTSLPIVYDMIGSFESLSDILGIILRFINDKSDLLLQTRRCWLFLSCLSLYLDDNNEANRFVDIHQDEILKIINMLFRTSDDKDECDIRGESWIILTWKDLSERLLPELFQLQPSFKTNFYTSNAQFLFDSYVNFGDHEMRKFHSTSWIDLALRLLKLCNLSTDFAFLRDVGLMASNVWRNNLKDNIKNLRESQVASVNYEMLGFQIECLTHFLCSVDLNFSSLITDVCFCEWYYYFSICFYSYRELDLFCSHDIESLLFQKISNLPLDIRGLVVQKLFSIIFEENFDLSWNDSIVIGFLQKFKNSFVRETLSLEDSNVLSENRFKM